MGSSSEKDNSPPPTYELDVILPSSTPVVGQQLLEHCFTFSRYWEKITCSVHESELATVQCMSCAALSLPVRWSYHCSTKCFLNAWPKHVANHNQVAQTASEANAGNQHTTRRHESYGSWPVFGDESKVCSSEKYRPSMDDLGFCLRLDSAALDSSSGSKLCPINIVVMDPVIGFPPRSPHCVMQVGGSLESWKLNREVQSSDDVENDIFESFFKPELTKCGHSILYKKKSSEEVYTGSQHVNDGCATIYRHDLFKEIKKYEVEFSKTAQSVVEGLEPGLKNEGYHLQKDNVALVVVLEALQRAATQKDHQSRICVANTHIFANTKYPDVKLYLVVNLIQGLQKIVETKVPLLICADLNSVPGSDPHRFLVRGKNDSTYEKKEIDPLGIHCILRLHHSLPLESGKMSINAARQLASDYNIVEQRPRDSVALSLEEPTPETAALPVTAFISKQYDSNGTDPPSRSEDDNWERLDSLARMLPWVFRRLTVLNMSDYSTGTFVSSIYGPLRWLRCNVFGGYAIDLDARWLICSTF